MLLVIDVGNSHTVVGVYDGETLQEHWRLQTHPGRTADEYRVVLKDLFDLAGMDTAAVHAAILASVVPPLSPVFDAVCRRTFSTAPLHVGPGIRTGMRIHYDNPREVGADRIVNAVAAFDAVGGAVVVVDFGTATTFDAVGEDGAYLGGAIAPGVAISVDALFHRAAKLPRVEVVRPDLVVGRDTAASIQSGTYYGYLGLVDGMVTRMRAEIRRGTGPEPACIATGGLASLFSAESTTIERVDPLLTLRGLRLLHELNRAEGQPG